MSRPTSLDCVNGQSRERRAQEIYYRCAATEMQVREWRICQAFRAYPHNAQVLTQQRWNRGLENELVHVRDLIGKMYLVNFEAPYIPELIAALMHFALIWEDGMYRVDIAKVPVPRENPPPLPKSFENVGIRWAWWTWLDEEPAFPPMWWKDPTIHYRDPIRIYRADWEEVVERLFAFERCMREFCQTRQHDIRGLETILRQLEEQMLATGNCN